MANVATQLRRIFGRSPGDDIPAFKQQHYLNLLSPEEMGSLISSSEQNLHLNFPLGVTGKKVLLVCHPRVYGFADRILKEKPSQLVCYHVAEPIAFNCPKAISLLGDIKPLSLKSGSFDWVIAPLAALHLEQQALKWDELAQAVGQGGKLVLSVVHPTLEFFMLNQHPASSGKSAASIADYLKRMKTQNLYLEELKEGCVDRETKPYFAKHDEVRHYDEFSGLPLTALFKSIKFQKKV